MDLLAQLREISTTWPSDTEAQIAPEEPCRVPMLDRGVSLHFLKTLVAGLKSLGRAAVDSGQLLNGVHTTSSHDDWKEFDRAKDAFCLKALTLHTGTSLVETCMAAGLVGNDGGTFFGPMTAFVSYSWRGPGVSFASLVATLEEHPTGSQDVFFFVDVLVCAQHRHKRSASGSCPNTADMNLFRHVIENCKRLLLYSTPITGPLVLGRAWCLYELMSALKLQKPVEVVLSRADQAHLARLLAEDFDAVVIAFTRIDSAAAEATDKRDLEMIKGWIISALGPHGFKTIDEEVANQLRAWLAATATCIVRERLEDDDVKATLLHNSARLLKHLAKFDEARTMYEHALAIREKALGKDHLDTVATVAGLAGTLYRLGEYDAAQPMFEKALAVREHALGADHILTVDMLGGLAGVLQSKGDYEKALALYESVLASKEKALGAAHTDTAGALHCYVSVLKRMGNYDAAQPMCEKALAIFENALGADHPHTASAQCNLAAVLSGKGDYEAAQPMFESALAKQTRALGADHPHTANSLCSFAQMLQSKGDYESARVMYVRALAIQQKAYGVDHPHTAKTLRNLDSVLKRKGGNDEAAQPSRMITTGTHNL